MIITLTFTLVKSTVVPLIIYIAPNMFIGWIETRPILMCTVMDPANWHIFFISVMSQIIFFKIILVVSPARFLQMNSSKTKFLCLVHLGFCVVYIMGHVIIYEYSCNGQAFLVLFKEIFKLEIFIPNLKEIEELKVIFYSGPVLFVVFIIEIGLQLYVAIKKMIKKKFKNQVIPLYDQNPSQLNSQNTGHSNSQNTSHDISYNYTLMCVSCGILQVLVFGVVINIKDVLLRTILIFLMNMLNRFRIHILPLLWILNHEPIKIYLNHKIYQIKLRFLH